MASAQGPRLAVDLQKWERRPALIAHDGVVITYEELAARADAFAEQLGADIKLLAITAENTVEPVVAYLAALRAGVPVAMLSGVGGKTGALANCPADAIYAPEVSGRWRLRRSPAPWPAAPHPDLALLLSTSGSVGNAKLVKLSRGNLQANAESIASYLELGPDERAITSLPLSYSYGLSVLNSHLSVGASIVLTSESVSDPKFRELVVKHGVTSLAGVPYSYEIMLRCGLLDDLPPTVRTLTQAGGRLSSEMIDQVLARAHAHGARFFVMYGQTEATARIAFLPPERLADHIGCIGGAIPAGELWLEGEDGRRLPLGEEGELVYRGPNVMMGYALERVDLAEPAGLEVLRTGDLAVQEAPGMFRITGRKSRFVKPYGLRVGLDELEQRFRAAGAEVVVTGDDQLIAACGAAGDEAAVRKAFGTLALPAELLEYVAADTAPRLEGGKPDYRRILEIARRQRDGEAKATGIAGVEALFRRVARGKPIGVETSFQTLGGDSLSYVQCAIVIEEALGYLPLSWEALTLSELGVLAEQRTATRGPVRITLETDILVRASAILLILFNHGFGGLSGGADILLMLAGYSWSRFQQSRLAAGAVVDVLVDFGRRYLIFYFVAILGVAALNRELDIKHLALVSTFFADWGGILNTYWFIETLTWCAGVVCLASTIGPVRKLMKTRPLQLGLGFVAVGLVARAAGSQLLDPAHSAFRSPDQMLVVFAIGWTVAQARGFVRAGLLALLAGLSGLAWGWTDTHLITMAIAAGAMMIGRVALPSVIASAITLVAAASFYIYLLNPLPMYLTDHILHARYGPYALAQIGATLAGGIGFYLALEFAHRWERSKVQGQAAVATLSA